MKIRVGLVVLLTVATCACRRSDAPQPEPESTPITVGTHDLELRVPDGWLHLDHGAEHRFHDGTAQISLADLGPATPDGFAREIRHARELFRRDQHNDAREHLATVRLRPAFESDDAWRDFSRLWRVLHDNRPDLGNTEMAYA